MLRKSFDDTSSSLLWNKINNLSGEWERILDHVQKHYKKGFDKGLFPSCLEMAAFEYDAQNYDLQAAFEFFFLQNDVEGVEKEWASWNE